MTTNQLKLTEILENRRHNQEMEKLGGQELNETIRHNIVYEGETNRHNVAYENETQRHNQRAEELSHEQNIFNYTVGMSQAAASHRMADAANAQARIAATRAINERIRDMATMRLNRMRVNNDYELGKGNLAVSQYNAETQRKKADAEIELGYWNYDLSADRIAAQNARDYAGVVESGSKTVKTIFDIGGNILGSAAGLLDLFSLFA